MTDMALAYDLEASDEPRFSNSLRFPMEAIPWRLLISMMCRVWFVQDSASEIFSRAADALPRGP